MRSDFQRCDAMLACLLGAFSIFLTQTSDGRDANPFLERHCAECHDAEAKKGGFDLALLEAPSASAEAFAKWVKVFDRIESDEMPPKKKARPDPSERQKFLQSEQIVLSKAEQQLFKDAAQTGLRRLTRAEYENTVRDLFSMPGILLQNELPADGNAHGFDKHHEALDLSHVNLAKYLDAAEKVLEMAIATAPEAPPLERQRLSLANNYEPDLMLMQGDAMLLRDGKIDPLFPPAGVYPHVGHGEHEKLGLFARESSVGVFRHEDESWNAYYRGFAALYPGTYRVRASFWSMTWDQGNIQPARWTEAARLSIVQLNGNGRGGQHPSRVLGYYDAPSLTPRVHEFETWLSPKETFGFNTASLAPVVLYRVGTWGQKDRTMGFTGPCIVNDWLDVEGPFYEQWPPASHRLLFGELPFEEFKPKDSAGPRMPERRPLRQEMVGAKNRPPPAPRFWSVGSKNPKEDAEKLLSDFLARAFRRPVERALIQSYVEKVLSRMASGDGFELAMRWACKAALCSPDFLYHAEAQDGLDPHALANRLSYFLWNSAPDAALRALADNGTISGQETLRAEVDRLLKSSKSQRFIEDFLGQWLKLRAIAANDPDKKLYPEFNPYLQDSMLAESHAFFREMIERDLDAGHLVASDFAMLNHRLALLYGIEGVDGPAIRRVPLPSDSVRGGFLTQAAILKVTANGTTTSPVPRGAYVMGRLLGRPPEPPPPNVPAVEPDVRGATTIRELLDRHRSDANCSACHARIDPPGFALECFDVIGGFRKRYRSLENGDTAERGNIDPKIGISFKLGPSVDASGAWTEQKPFADLNEFRRLLLAEKRSLLRSLARQLAVYSSGRALAFSDRGELELLLDRVESRGGGVRTLITELVCSPLFSRR